MAERLEIRLAGSGGQGVILAGVVLAEAAGIHEGREVAQTQSYGPEARGGAARAEVVISDGEIDYPKAMQPDILLCLSQRACDAYVFDLKPDGTILVDAELVQHLPTTRAVALPFARLAREQVGEVLMANMVALGALAALTGVVSLKSLEAAVQTRVPQGHRKKALAALEVGALAAREHLAQKETYRPTESDADPL